MKSRRILIIIAAGFALLVGGLVLAAVLIPQERVADAVADRAQAILGQPVAIERFGVSIFPLPGVRLAGVSVGGTDSTALARVDALDLRVRILPLFGGRVVVRSLELERPRIAVVLDDTGAANFPVLAGDDAAQPSNADITFAVDGIRVADGSIRYQNRQDGSRIHLTGWNQALSVAGQVEAGELTTLQLAGWLALDNIEADLPGAVLPARDLSLRVEHDAALDLAADRLDLARLTVGFDGVEVAGGGRVEGLNSGRPYVRLDLAADGLDAGRLLAWVPDSLQARMRLPDGRTVGLRGAAAIHAVVDGTVAPDTLPAVDGSLRLQGVAVAVGSDALLEEVDGDVVFSLDSVVARFDGQALGQAFNAGMAVRNPAAPLAVVALSGSGDLSRLPELGLVPDSLGLEGTVRIDLRAQLPVQDPATARALGSIDASGVTLAGLDPVVRVPTAFARFEGDSVRVQPFRVELGPDRAGIRLDIAAVGWIPAAVDSNAAPPRVSVTLEADSLDMDALLGPSESGYPPLLFARLRDRTIDGRAAEAIAEEMGLAVPPLPPVDARLDARIGALQRNGLLYRDMDARITVTETAAVLEHVRFGLMGGRVEASGRMEPTRVDSAGAPLETRVAGAFDVSNVGAQRFFDTLTPFKDHLSGRLDLAGTVSLQLDRVALPVRPSLAADGAMTVADGTLANWAVLQNVTGRLGITGFDTLRFSDWTGSFRIEGTRVHLDETGLQGVGLDAEAQGYFDFGGQIDVRATAGLSPELARRAGAVGQELLAATGGDVPVGLRIQGNVEDPDVALDLGPARQAVTGRVREAAGRAAREAEETVRDAAAEAEAEARERAQQAADQIQGRVEEEAGQLADQAAREASERIELPDSLRDLPADSLRALLGDSAFALLPDSVKARADSLQQALEAAIRERLRRLLPGGGGGGGS